MIVYDELHGFRDLREIWLERQPEYFCLRLDMFRTTHDCCIRAAWRWRKAGLITMTELLELVHSIDKVFNSKQRF